MNCESTMCLDLRANAFGQSKNLLQMLSTRQQSAVRPRRQHVPLLKYTAIYIHSAFLAPLMAVAS